MQPPPRHSAHGIPADGGRPKRTPRDIITALFLWVGLFTVFCVYPVIFFPQLVGYPNYATKSKLCLSNVRHESILLLTYADSWDDRLPPSGRWMDSVEVDEPNFRLKSLPLPEGRSGS